MNNKIRYAIVGLGHIAQTAVLPAFEHAENSELAALVTGNPEKDRELSERYSVRAYAYDDLEKAVAAQHIDAVYIATPNSLHREYTERAARAGAHVLCEKPMAPTEEDCEAMMRAAEENKVKLMIAYRLHFNDANLRAVELRNPETWASSVTLVRCSVCKSTPGTSGCVKILAGGRCMTSASIASMPRAIYFATSQSKS